MKTEKQTYIAPQIDRIKLDNEIALQLESYVTPPYAPGETGLIAPEYFKNNPFKSNMG